MGVTVINYIGYGTLGAYDSASGRPLTKHKPRQYLERHLTLTAKDAPWHPGTLVYITDIAPFSFTLWAEYSDPENPRRKQRWAVVYSVHPDATDDVMAEYRVLVDRLERFMLKHRGTRNCFTSPNLYYNELCAREGKTTRKHRKKSA